MLDHLSEEFFLMVLDELRRIGHEARKKRWKELCCNPEVPVAHRVSHVTNIVKAHYYLEYQGKQYYIPI